MKHSIAVCLVMFIGMTISEGAHAQQAQTTLTLRATSSRPVLDLVQQIGTTTGVIIDYEDVPIVFEGDVHDRLDDQRIPMSERQGRKKRALIPARASVEVNYSADSERMPQDVSRLLLDLVERGSNKAHSFALLKSSPTLFHVVPVSRRNSKGDVETVVPLLDTRISFPAASRTISQSVDLLLKNVSMATGTEIQLFMSHPSMSKKTSVGASNEIARDVLRRLLAEAEPRLVYHLLCEPQDSCAMVIRYVFPVRSRQSSRPKISPSQSDPTLIPFMRLKE